MYLYDALNESIRTTQRNRRNLMLYFSRVFQKQKQKQQKQHRNQVNRIRLWAWRRPQNWFHLLIARRDLNPIWKMHVRVTRPILKALCDLLRVDLRMRAPVSVEERVGLALWRLATGDSFNVMRWRNFHSMNFPQFWYKDSLE